MATINVDSELWSSVQNAPVMCTRLQSKLGKDCILTSDQIHKDLTTIRTMIEDALTRIAHGNAHLLAVPDFKIQFTKMVNEGKNLCESMRRTERLMQPYLNSTRLKDDCMAILNLIGNIDNNLSFVGFDQVVVNLGESKNIRVDNGASYQKVSGSSSGITVTEGSSAQMKLQTGLSAAAGPAGPTTTQTLSAGPPNPLLTGVPMGQPMATNVGTFPGGNPYATQVPQGFPMATQAPRPMGPPMGAPMGQPMGPPMTPMGPPMGAPMRQYPFPAKVKMDYTPTNPAHAFLKAGQDVMVFGESEGLLQTNVGLFPNYFI